MKNKLKDILTVICFVICIIGMAGAIVGCVAQSIYQLIEYGVYSQFIIPNHWGAWLMFGGIGLIVVGAVGFLAILEWM